MKYLLVACFACSATPHQATPQVTGSALRAMIDQRCADCHDGNPNRPDLVEKPIDHELAWLAADAVASGQMPPNVDLLDHEREAIVAQLCSALGSEAERCVRETYVGDLPALARPAKVLQAEVEKTWHLSPEAMQTLDGINSATAQWYSYDNVNLRASLGLAAMQGCAGSADEIEKCIRGMLARDLVRPTPPPGPR